MPDFATTFNDDAARAELDAAGAVPGNQYLPLEVFAKAGRDLVTNDVTLASLFREADMADNSGMAVSRDPDKFHVIVTTRFSEAEFRDYLFGNEWGLPKPESQYRFIVIDHGDDVPLLT